MLRKDKYMARKNKEQTITYIVLFDGYAVSTDKYGYAACKKIGIDKETGNIKYKGFSFHSDLDGALKAIKKDYAKKVIMSHDMLTLDDAISVIVRSNNRFEAMIKNAFDGVTV